MENTSTQKWSILAGFIFAFAGLSSLLLTDLFFSSGSLHKNLLDRLWLTKEPLFLASSLFPPGFFAAFAAYRWKAKKSKLFGGWFNVSITAWLSLVINPMVWFLVLVSYMVYGFIALFIFIGLGVLLSIVLAEYDNA